MLVVFGEYSADLGRGILFRDEATLKDGLAAICIKDADTTRNVVHRVVAGVDLLHSRLELVKTDGEGRFGALDVSVGELLIEVVIDNRVRELRPAVEKIPPDNTRLSRSADTDTLDEVLFRLCLAYL